MGSGKYKMSVGNSIFEVSGSMLQDNNVCHLNCVIDGNVSRSRIVIQGRDMYVFTPVSEGRLYRGKAQMLKILIMLILYHQNINMLIESGI